jgi:hypothetical protein
MIKDADSQDSRREVVFLKICGTDQLARFPGGKRIWCVVELGKWKCTPQLGLVGR